jgi:HNH endonuclease/GIY-YIG catalytic domain
MGIYVIRNILTGHCYVGRAYDLKRRWAKHRQDLARGRHYNRRLQAAWTQCGASAFRFAVLDYVDERDDLLSAEQQWTAALAPLYNLKPTRATAVLAARRKGQRLGTWNARVITRFWAKVHKTEGCWEWTGSLAHGYGQFALCKERDTRRAVLMRAHRFSYILAHGPLDDGLLVLHLCDNRKCVRPDHLIVGTYRANTADMRAKGRSGDLLGEAVPNHRRTVEMVRAMRQRYAAGESIKALAQGYGMSRGTASDIIHGRSWRHIEGAQPVASERVRRAAVDLTHVARGERVGNAKLTAGAVRAIRARYNAGDISYADLAREYGLSRRTIRLAVIGKRWAHVKGA